MRSRTRWAVAAAAFLSVLAIGATPANAIANGEPVPDGKYRFSVKLTMTGIPTADGGRRNSACSGALIAPQWVITAGHCFRTADGRRVSRTVADRTTATIGRADLSSGEGYEAEVVAVRQAEGADVALAEIDPAVTDITPLRVGTAPPTVGEVVRLTGYGLTAGDGSEPAQRLQTGQFVVGRTSDSLIETSGKAPRADTSPCPHDSGGPYFRQQRDGTAVLVAVVSGGPRCPHPGPDFSARTDNLADWIADTTGDRHLITYGLSAFAALAAVVLLGLAVRWRRR